LKALNDSINYFCQRNAEDKGDVLFFSLQQHLKDNNDARHSEITDIWKNTNTKLTPSQFLALRIDTLQKKNPVQFPQEKHNPLTTTQRC